MGWEWELNSQFHKNLMFGGWEQDQNWGLEMEFQALNFQGFNTEAGQY